MNWLKHSTVAIICIVGTVLVMRWTASEPEPIPEHRDDARIARTEAERDKAIEERDGLAFKIKTLLGTKDPEEPRLIVRGNIDRPLSFEWAMDTVKKEKTLLPTMDVILYGSVDEDGIKFYTANLYREYLGGEARTVYEWERKRRDFYFAMKDKGGVVLTFDNPFLDFEGLWAGAGVDVMQRPFLSLEGRLMVLGTVELSLGLTSTPELTAQARVRL